MPLYRSMKPDEDGFPHIASTKLGLGVVTDGPNLDLLVWNGQIGPLSGGMTVARDWRDLPEHRLPTKFGGTSKATLFELAEEDVPPGLRVRWSPPPEGHYTVEPERMMPVEEYEALLRETRLRWRQVPTNESER